MNNEYLNIKRKVYSVYKILLKRLPKGYCAPVKCYSSVYYMVKNVAKEMDMGYEEAKLFYSHYYNNLTNETNYIDTKYYNPKDKVKHREECFTVDAFSGKPIYVACDNIQLHSKAEIAFLLLHEYGHMVLKTNNERKCDLFAIKWTRKLLKEGLL